MKLSEAEKRLHEFISCQDVSPDRDFYEAVKLGRQALKRLKEGREKGYDFFGHPLPGETPDDE